MISRYEDLEKFQKSFGNSICEDQIYYNPNLIVDGKKLAKMADERNARHEEHVKKYQEIMAIQKASIDAGSTGGIGTGGAGTAGSALIPVYVDPTIIDLTRRQTPLVELIPRRAVKGKTFEFDQLTSRAAAVFAVEDASMVDQVSTYDRDSTAVKWAYSVGRVTGQAVAAMRGFVDAMSLDIMDKTIALRELHEDKILNGDASTTPKEFTGFKVGITNNSRSLSGGNVTIQEVRTEADTIFNDSGNCNLSVNAATTNTYLKGQLMDFQRYVDKAENLPFGIAGSFSIDGINFIKSRFMTEAAASRVSYFIDTSSWEMGVLQDATYEELAKTADSKKYMIKEYSTLVRKADKFNSQLTSVA